MNQEKINLLKKNVKMKGLASLAQISPIYLSNVLHGREKPSQELAQKLADLSNTLSFSNSFTAEDFKG